MKNILLFFLPIAVIVISIGCQKDEFAAAQKIAENVVLSNNGIVSSDATTNTYEVVIENSNPDDAIQYQLYVKSCNGIDSIWGVNDVFTKNLTPSCSGTTYPMQCTLKVRGIKISDNEHLVLGTKEGPCSSRPQMVTLAKSCGNGKNIDVIYIKVPKGENCLCVSAWVKKVDTHDYTYPAALVTPELSEEVANEGFSCRLNGWYEEGYERKNSYYSYSGCGCYNN